MIQEKQFDIVIIGAGPSGSKTAQKAAQKGARVLLIEAKKRVGKPIQCAGIISKRAFQLCNLPQSQIVRRIQGARVFSPNGKKLKLQTEKPQSYVINRTRFDQALLEQAKKAGAHILKPARAVSFQSPHIKIKKEGKSLKKRTKILIGADGPQSKTREWLGLSAPPRKIFGYQVEIKTKTELGSLVNIYFNNDFFRGFFGWSIPTEKNRARVGLGTASPKMLKKGVRYILNTHHPESEILKHQGGIIPIGFSKQTYTDRGLIVGDAAGQVKPTSGGGVFTGITCAKIAGRIAAKKAQNNKTSSEQLAQYEKTWKKKLGRELRFGYLVSQAWKHTPNFLISHLLTSLEGKKIKKKIKKHGDPDFPSKVTKKVLETPQFWKNFFFFNN